VSANAQVVGGGPVIGGGGGDLSAYVLLAGDEDGQTIQGLAGNNKARIELSPEGEPAAARMVGGGAANTAVVFADQGYAGLRSPDTNTDCSVTNGALSCNSDNSVAFGVNPNGGYFGANPTGFYFGGPTVNIASSQTPPTNANDACTQGDTIDTATFHYYCAATNTWVRVAMATW